MLIAGSTSVSVPILVRDTTSTTGAGLSGLTHETSGLVAEYRREGQSSWTAITLAAGTLGTWSSGGFVADGSLTGAYELGLPNAAVAEASGVRWVAVRLRGAANMLATPLFIPLMPSTVNLADDAIKASKFDESTAFPLKANDAGATQVARTGADGDTMETLSDQADAIKSDSAAILLDTGTDGVVVAPASKSGYSLAATGLDSITATDPGGVASTFPQMVVQTWRRWFKKATLTATQLKTYGDDNTTVRTTQATSDDNTTQTQGDAS